MRKQKGFSLVEGLLIVLVIAVVGAGGWYVSVKNNDISNSSKASTGSSSSLEPSIASNNTANIPQKEGIDSPTVFNTSEWTNVDVDLDNGGFSFKHPSTFTSFTKCTNAHWVYARSESNDTNIEFNDPSATAKETECFGFGDVIIFSIEEFDGQGNSKARSISAPAKLVGTANKVSIDGMNGEKICVKENSQPIANGPTIIKQCQYNAKTSDAQLWMSYSVLEGANPSELDNVMDTLAGTIIFTNAIR